MRSVCSLRRVAMVLLGRARAAYTRLLYLAREHSELLSTAANGRDEARGAAQQGRRPHEGEGEEEEARRRREAAVGRVRRAFRAAAAEADDAGGSGGQGDRYLRQVERAEYVVREVEALVRLHKYRAMKSRYYDEEPG